jgi:hypothetical protein
VNRNKKNKNDPENYKNFDKKNQSNHELDLKIFISDNFEGSRTKLNFLVENFFPGAKLIT